MTTNLSVQTAGFTLLSSAGAGLRPLRAPARLRVAPFPVPPYRPQACLRLGIDPSTLLHRPYKHFLRVERHPELAKLAFDHEERLRQDRLRALIEERRRIEDGQRGGSSTGAKVGAEERSARRRYSTAGSCLLPAMGSTQHPWWPAGLRA